MFDTLEMLLWVSLEPYAPTLFYVLFSLFRLRFRFAILLGDFGGELLLCGVLVSESPLYYGVGVYAEIR